MRARMLEAHFVRGLVDRKSCFAGIKGFRDSGIRGLGGLAVLCVLCVSVVPLSGCAQNTEAPLAQPSRQVQAERGDQAAQGAKTDIRVYIQNAPAGGEVPTEQAPLIIQTPSQPAVLDAGSATAGATVRDTRAGYVQAGFTLNITTGAGTTGAQATGGISGQSNTPTATVTQSPTQRPEAQVNPAIAFGMPGSAPNASSTSSGFEGGGPVTATISPTQSATLQNLLFKGMQGDQAALQQFSQLAAQLLGIKAPTTQATAP